MSSPPPSQEEVSDTTLYSLGTALSGRGLALVTEYFTLILQPGSDSGIPESAEEEEEEEVVEEVVEWVEPVPGEGGEGQAGGLLEPRPCLQ